MDRRSLAAAVKRRRHQLDRTLEDVAERAGLARLTVGQVEQARPVNYRTLWKLDLGLDWVQGSCHDYLTEGIEPVPTTIEPDLDDPDERDIWGLERIPLEARRGFIALLRRKRAAAGIRTPGDAEAS